MLGKRGKYSEFPNSIKLYFYVGTTLLILQLFCYFFAFAANKLYLSIYTYMNVFRLVSRINHAKAWFSHSLTQLECSCLPVLCRVQTGPQWRIRLKSTDVALEGSLLQSPGYHESFRGRQHSWRAPPWYMLPLMTTQ